MDRHTAMARFGESSEHDEVREGSTMDFACWIEWDPGNLWAKQAIAAEEKMARPGSGYDKWEDQRSMASNCGERWRESFVG